MSVHVPVIESITKANDLVAAENRALLDRHRILGLNLLAAPGAGKTSLIEATLSRLPGDCRPGVIEADLATSLDAERTARAGARSVQLNVASCHLDAPMVRGGLENLPLGEIDLLLVENIGNLICPAGFALGTHLSVLVASVPEGDDKPFKYPRIYRGLDAVVVNKIDLLPHVPFDLARFRRGVAPLNDSVAMFPLSCRTGEGVEGWMSWLRARIEERREKG